jgi:pimeloyl-ACP methyl ester carboxylesterase
MSVLFVSCLLGCASGTIPEGPARCDVEVGGICLEVFTYKPTASRGGPLLVVFHGVLRNAEEYRDNARVLGDRYGLTVAAPKFDEARFGPGRYQQGGLLRDGTPEPEARRTWSLVPPLVDELRRREGRPDMPFYLIGCSGGGQFLERMAGFSPTKARRVVAVNPGTQLFPTRDQPYPFGYGGLPPGLSGDDRIKAYLAQPLTLYLGTADTERDEYLDTSPAADAQGRSRLERGRAAFAAAKALAAERGWEFGWWLVEAHGLGHEHGPMFSDPACGTALFGPGWPEACGRER